MKKGQGLSITTIVVAAIALLVLVVLVAVFTGQIGDKNRALKSCETTGGECHATKPPSTDGTIWVMDPTKACVNSDGTKRTQVVGDKTVDLNCYVKV